MITQSWNNGVWENAQRVTHTYDGAGKLLTAVSDLWFSTNWQAFSKVTNTYAGNGYLTNSLTQAWDFVSSIFKNNTEINYTNNANGTVSSSIEQKWNLSTNVWENFQRMTFTYTASNKVLISTTERWINGNWVNFSKDTNTYDSSEYLVNALHQSWDATFNIFKNDSQSIISNNVNGIPTQIVSQEWVDALSVWVNATRTTFFYGSLGINDFWYCEKFCRLSRSSLLPNYH